MTGEDFISQFIVPYRNGLERTRAHAERMQKPGLRMFLLSILDQETDGLNDIEAVCGTGMFPALDQDSEKELYRLIGKLTGADSVQTDELQLLRHMSRSYGHAAELYNLLAAQSADSAVHDSFLNQAAEERKRARLLEDRISLEELTH